MKRQDVLISPASLDLPLVKSGSGKTMVEIGFGNGEFLLHTARDFPEARIFGIEISITCVEKALKRVFRERVPNVKIISGDARFVLRETFADEVLDRIYMSFPCPWPKERHARRRVTYRGFADTLGAVLKEGGCFELATDERWYADEVAKVLNSHDSLRLVSFETNKRRKITTKYERKWLEEGKDIFLLVFQKSGSFSVPRIVEGRCDDMHMTIDKGREDLSVLAGASLNLSDGEEGAHWTLGRVYANGDGVWLIQAISSDDGYEQKFYLRVVSRDEGVLVKVDGFSCPFLTPAVRSAVEALALRLCRR